jgi:quinol monooxygenase YgiN
MAKVSVVAKLTAAPGKRDAVVDALKDVVAGTEQEPGTLVYALNVEKDGDVIWFFELYTDEAALAVHGKSEAMKAAGPKLAGNLAGAPEIIQLTPVVAKGLPL